MRPGPAAIAGLLLGLALVLSACGGGETTAAGKSGAAGVESRGAASAAQAAAGCGPPLRSFVGRLDELRGNLAVGLSYDAYLDEVTGAKAAYSEVRAERISLDCLARVGTPAERALNEYIAGVNAWGDCLALASCEPTSIEAELKDGWEVASGYLSSAQRGLRKIS